MPEHSAQLREGSRSKERVVRDRDVSARGDPGEENPPSKKIVSYSPYAEN